MLSHPMLGRTVPLLFLANKRDLPTALSPVEIAQVGGFVVCVQFVLVVWGCLLRAVAGLWLLNAPKANPTAHAITVTNSRHCDWRISGSGPGRSCPAMP